MNPTADFLASLSASQPPEELSAHLQALWRLRRGDAARTHALVQALAAPGAAAMYAHLHRIEGDLASARYGYARAGVAPGSAPIDSACSRLLQRSV